ncbi:MAG: diguanylate cyclase [Candidatus Thiodiazotropha sp. LLP2]
MSFQFGSYLFFLCKDNLLPITDLENAALVAERIRLSISTQSVACQDFEFTLTVTLGLAVNNNYDESLDRLIERADRALYIGKANGKTNTSLLTRA